MGLGSRGTQRKSRGSGRFYLCCGREWAVRKFCGRPMGNGGIWRVIETESTHEVEKEIKAAVYFTKAKQGKSDIWKQFSIVTEIKGELNLLVSCDKCAKVFVYNEHKSGTSDLRRHTYFLSSMCLFI